MSSPHICLACRRRLGQLRFAKVAQWQSRATFISLSNNKARKTTDEKSTGRALRSGDVSRDKEGNYEGVAPHRKIPLSRPRKITAGDVLESLFEQTIHPPPVQDEVAPDSTSTLEPYKNAETLKDMISKAQPLAKSWAFFVEHFGPNATEAHLRERSQLPSYLRPTANDLFKKIVHAKEQNPISPILPSATELSKVFLQLGLLHGSDWSRMVAAILQSLLKIKQQGLNDLEGEKELILDLLGAWNVVCRDVGHYQTFSASESLATYWTSLPPISNKDAAHVAKKRGTQSVFGLLVPPFPARETTSLPLVTLATFAILSEKPVATENYHIDSAPLLVALSRVVSVPGLDIGQFYQETPSPSLVEIADYVRSAWFRIREKASILSQVAHSQVDRKRAERLSSTSAQISVTFVNRRLHEALIKRNLRQVDELWTDVVRWQVDTSRAEPTGTERGVLSINLANYFVLVYMGLRQPNRAIDVWNHMVSSGLTPNLRTWESMMSGCRTARDYKGLEQVWSKMRLAQVAPDNHCWVTRISGLIDCRRIDAGIAALDEMGRIWLDAAKKKHPRMSQSELQLVNDVDGAIKPSIEAINAAIGALFKMDMSDVAYRVLAWAGKFGIAPDIITYNTLLRPLVRAGQTKEAMALLKRMQMSGIQADAYTFTIILDETFQSMEDLTSQEISEIVDGVFAEMEASGIAIDVPIYGKIIRQLLPNGSIGDMSTVNAVMERMEKQGIDPGAQIYTMLLEHYFAQTPPNMDAVRNTIERASRTKGGSDEKFWDRAIEGYARENETGPAMRILGKVQDNKGRAGWTAMRMLLLALVENQEWDVARTLVNNAIIDNGASEPVEGHGMERRLERAFWKLARDFGLVEQAPPKQAGQEFPQQASQ